jgi:hypothetical protein
VIGQLLEEAILDHVGIAAESAETPLSLLVGDRDDLTTMPSGVAVARFGAERALELVVPARSGSPIDRFLEKRGPGLHHVALRVEKPLAELLPEIEQAGLKAVGPITPSSDGRLSVFLHPSSTGGVLIELVEGRRSTEHR